MKKKADEKKLKAKATKPEEKKPKEPREKTPKKTEAKALEKKTTPKKETLKKEAPKKKETAAKKPETPKRAAKPTASPEKKPETPKKAAKPTASPEKKPASVKAATKKPAKGEDFDDNINISETVAVTEGGATRSGKFDIRRAKDGRFFFNLYASNYAVIAYSQMYSSTQSALTGIKSVMANASGAEIEDTTPKKPVSLPFPKWEIYIDRAGEYRFRLYSSNGNCICHSHGYSTKATCKGGIESIIRFSNESDIKKSYKK